MKPTISVGGRTGTAYNPTAYEWGTSRRGLSGLWPETPHYSCGGMSDAVLRLLCRLLWPVPTIRHILPYVFFYQLRIREANEHLPAL